MPLAAAAPSPRDQPVPTPSNRLSIAALLALALLAAPGAATAERADRNKPMNVEADALRYDDLNQTSVFTGRVVITKGSIVIRGARIEVRQDAEGYQHGVVTAEPGKLAFYRQKREGVDEFIEGEGEVIEYDGKADRVKFIRRAELRRFRGATLADEIVGSVVSYDNGTDTFSVDGGAASAAAGGRVRAVLAPRNGASAPAAPPAPLRPSTTLDGGRK
jgi:lipopolysaccharide export system protein LptA